MFKFVQQICDFQAELKLADFHHGACQKQTEVLLLSKYHFQIVAHLRFEMMKINKLPLRKLLSKYHFQIFAYLRFEMRKIQKLSLRNLLSKYHFQIVAHLRFEMMKN